MPMLNAESCVSSYVSRRAENEYDSRRGLICRTASFDAGIAFSDSV